MRSPIRLIGFVAALCVAISTVVTAHAAHPAKFNLVHPGYLTVGTDATYPPMESYNPATRQYQGADIDLANALAKTIGLKGAIIVNNSFDTIIAALQREKFDVIMSSMGDTPERRKKIDFVDYMRGETAIVVKANSAIHANSFAQLCGVTIAVERGTTELDSLNQANAHCSKKIQIKTYTADTDAFEALISGHADAYTTDYPVAALYVKEHPGALRLAGKPIVGASPYGIGILHKNITLEVALMRAVRQIIKNGTYKTILTKWGVQSAGL